MIKFVKRACALAAVAAVAFGTSALSQNFMNFSGTYRCEASAIGCDLSGATFTVMQSGNSLSVSNDKNWVGSGTVTSNITISMGPPWNMLGVIQDPGTIEWSNGTTWRKQ